MPRPDRRPLIAYLKVQEAWERELLIVLKRAAADADKQIRALAGKDGIGAAIRREQLRLVKQALLKQQAELWDVIGSSVKAAQARAAAAAVASTGEYEAMLLKSKLSKGEIEAMLRAATAQAERTVDVVSRRLNGLSDRPLSSRVYRSRALANGMVQREIERVIATGGSWKDLANRVRGLILPNTPGGVSYAAERLGRTELNNAFHAVSVQRAIKSPFIEYVQWHLSGSHPKPDDCNIYADEEHVKGQPGGIWRPQEVPSKPHPNCLCYTTPITISDEEFIDGFISGKYDAYLDG